MASTALKHLQNALMTIAGCLASVCALPSHLRVSLCRSPSLRGSSGPDFVRFYNPYGYIVYLLRDGSGYGAACGLRLHIDVNSRSVSLLRQPHAYANDAWDTQEFRLIGRQNVLCHP